MSVFNLRLSLKKLNGLLAAVLILSLTACVNADKNQADEIRELLEGDTYYVRRARDVETDGETETLNTIMARYGNDFYYLDDEVEIFLIGGNMYIVELAPDFVYYYEIDERQNAELIELLKFPVCLDDESFAFTVRESVPDEIFAVPELDPERAEVWNKFPLSAADFHFLVEYLADKANDDFW
jgi:hypothetical protein